MNQEERDKLIAQLEDKLSDPEARQAMRFVASAFGSLPVLGGSIAGVGALQGEREQHEINQNIINWAILQDTEIQNIADQLDRLLAGPTRVRLAFLIEEILGKDIASDFLSQSQANIAVVLNAETRSELEPYITNGWISVESTRSVCTMGTGCRVGNHLEELKRPYGLGNGFILTSVG